MLLVGLFTATISKSQELVQNGNFAAGSANWNYYSTYSWEITFNPNGQNAVTFDNWSHIWQDLSATYQPGVSYIMTVQAQVGAAQLDGLNLGLTSVQTGDWPPLVSIILPFPGADQNPTNAIAPPYGSPNTNVPSSSPIETFTWIIDSASLSNAITSNHAGATWGNNIDFFVNPSENSGDYGWLNVFSVSFQQITTNTPPVPVKLLQQPLSQTVPVNATASFSVQAQGWPLPAYQWYKVSGGVTNVILSATNNTYSTGLVQNSDTGTGYFVVASNTTNSVASSTAILTVSSVSQELVKNGNFANGSTNWNFYRGNVSEMTFNPNGQNVVTMDNWSHIWQDLSATYQVGNSYVMTVQAQVGAGQMDGLNLGLTSVQTGDWPPLVSTTLPFPAADQNPTTTNVPSSSPIQTFTWIIDWTSISNAIKSTTSGATWGNNIDFFVNPSENSGDYGWLNVYSVSFKQLTVPLPVQILLQPASQRVLTNTTATFSVQAQGWPFPTYQWYEVVGGVTNMILNATNVTYTTSPVQDNDTGTGYFAVASNVTNSVASSTAIVTAGHLLGPVSGFLEADEYFNNYPNNLATFEALYPTAPSLPTPNKVEYLAGLNGNADLPNDGGERIYGWFTPPVSGNYIFFAASDDSATLWLSTNGTAANTYEIAQNHDWMVSGNDGPTDWTDSYTNSGEFKDVTVNGTAITNEWRSDGFETSTPNDSFLNFYSSWTQWPGLNPDGSISLTAGTSYYIELDHWQGGAGQGAAVTYKLAGSPDPTNGATTLLTGSDITVIDAMDGSAVEITSQPVGAKVQIGSSAKFNVGAITYVVGAPTARTPISYQWYVVSTGATNAIGGATGSSYTTASTVLSDSGKQFYCTVSTVGVQTNSSLATLTVLQPHPQIVSITLSGGNMILSGTNGTFGQTYYVLSSTNVALPLNQWTRVLTNTFGNGGTFTVTNSVTSGSPRQFYLLQVP
ncbi:MAG TPA: hypothetical protein VNX46_10790 [Candidatus Acidoferrum sp.]|nr:hypothetical protein [Candidatus Acidoferrum sp.]